MFSVNSENLNISTTNVEQNMTHKSLNRTICSPFRSGFWIAREREADLAAECGKSQVNRRRARPEGEVTDRKEGELRGNRRRVCWDSGSVGIAE